MTPADAARVLAVAVVYDRRTVGELDAKAWADALDGLDPRECAEAVRWHYRDSTDWLMPARVRQIVKSRRHAELEKRHTERVLTEIAAAKARAVPRPQLTGGGDAA